MLHNLDIGRQVMPSNAAGGWLLICAALLLGAVVVVLVRGGAANLAARIRLSRERDINQAVSWAEPPEGGPADPEDPEATSPVRSRQVDLARNNLQLLVRQLAFIDELKAHESDPDTFADLDRLEQLTQQMRRNCTSVMLVAGLEPVRIHHRPMPASEVLRQALGGIEQSARVTLSIVADPIVPAQKSGPLMHVFAEVIDNATRFSEPTSTVMVLVSHTEDGLRVRVADDGAGIGPEKLAELNDLIANPPTGASPDVAGVRGLGLAAAGRVAGWIGAEVTLSSSIGRGTVASIDLPLNVTADDDPAEAFPALAALPDDVPAPADDADLEPHPVVPVAQAPIVQAPIVQAPIVQAPVETVVEAPPAPLPFERPTMPPVMAIPNPVPASIPVPIPTLNPVPAPRPDRSAPVQAAPADQLDQADHPDQADQPLGNLSGISWLSAVAEPPPPPLPTFPGQPGPAPAGAYEGLDSQPRPTEYLPTHAAAEAAIRPPAPWDLDDDPTPSTALAIDVLPRRKTLLPGKNRPRRDQLKPDASGIDQPLEP